MNNSSKRKIAILTPFVANGGLEKVAIVAAEELRKKFDVTLIVMDTFHIDYVYEGKQIDLNVSLINRNFIKRLWNISLSIIKLRKLKKKHTFEIVISHGELANLPNIFSGGKKNILVVHSNRFAAVKDYQGKLVNNIIKYIYSFKNIYKIVTVSEGIRISFINKLKLKPNKIQTIYNPYNINRIKTLASEELKTTQSLFRNDVIITAGRLSKPKGQWYILRIFKQLKLVNPNLKLVILGYGEIKDKLTKLSQGLNLKTYSAWASNNFNEDYDVYFMGFVKNPFKYISKSKLFVMTSLWEGFGNTIVEAMACSTPVISTACQSGPGEIINPNLEDSHKILEPNFEGNGILMPIFQKKFIGSGIKLNQIENLWINTIKNLLQDDHLLQEFIEKGLLRANDFNVIPIVSEWNKILKTNLND